MTAHFLRRVATLGLVASCIALVSSCSLFRSSVPAERDLSVQLAGWMVQELAASLEH